LEGNQTCKLPVPNDYSRKDCKVGTFSNGSVEWYKKYSRKRRQMVMFRMSGELLLQNCYHISSCALTSRLRIFFSAAQSATSGQLNGRRILRNTGTDCACIASQYQGRVARGDERKLRFDGSRSIKEHVEQWERTCVIG